MKEIVDRLKENRQIELAKSILESAGYKVSKPTKKLREGYEKIDMRCDEFVPHPEAIEFSNMMLNDLEEYFPEYYEDGDGDKIEAVYKALDDVLKRDADSVFYSDCIPEEYEITSMIEHTGNDFFGKGFVEDEEGNKYAGYFLGNMDGVINFIRSDK